MSTDSGYIENNGAQLYYEQAGKGPALVFIHAGVADSRQWKNEFNEFAGAYRVLRYDMRGYGKSLPADGEFSHMDDLVSLKNQLGIDEPIILVGCSMGGTLAMDYSLDHPTRVEALVMVGSGPSGLKLDVPDHPKAADAAVAYDEGDLDRVAELEAQIWFDGMGREPDQVDPEMRALALDMNRTALAHVAQQTGKRLPDANLPAAERIQDLRIPVLIIVGEHDIPYIQSAADVMLAEIPAARKVEITGAAHLPNMDRPQAFRQALQTFLVDVS